ncbi:hypothetical protein HPB50_011155 [Hyalomma asiaticum]|uniref:Uncharacterized protein n=1 Tax=Hyalomma asiaticum TaxID=266040 RepID=A0ACB7TIH0_HYAAI|nr:hypothetical protein HPB50_011155 [Hyalomma asiaticum]
MRVIDVLEYVHSYDYIRADVKASVLLLGFGKGSKNKVHLVDFALACRFTQNGKHKEYKEDCRNAHDGTIEFTSRDNHIGTHSRRGGMEMLDTTCSRGFVGDCFGRTTSRTPSTSAN